MLGAGTCNTPQRGSPYHHISPALILLCSSYVGLVRSLSAVLNDSWLDVRELTPGDRVTQEIAHAAATVRCLVIFFSYEYLRSVNCTLEFLTALRYRSLPQRTIILLEALSPRMRPVRALSVDEARVVADLLTEAIPGLIIAYSVPELLDIIDRQCVRAADDAGISTTIAWWTKHGKARINRVTERIRVVPPLLHDQMRHYWSVVCSCRRRRRGDVAGGFSLIRGDGSKVKWYRPPDSAALTMMAVICVEALVYAHMFLYCAPGMSELVANDPSFRDSCLPSSIFLYTVSLLPFAMVVLQFCVNMRADATHLHDSILLPLNVAAHSSGVRAVLDRVHRAERMPFASLLQTVRAARSLLRLDTAPSLTSRMDTMDATNSSRDGFSIVFVTSNVPCATFVTIASNMSDFVTNRAIGISSSTIRICDLPAAARRMAIYVFFLDSTDSVDTFYRRVHCAPVQFRRTSQIGSVGVRPQAAWPTCQIVVLCHADVIKTPDDPGTNNRGGRRPDPSAARIATPNVATSAAPLQSVGPAASSRNDRISSSSSRDEDVATVVEAADAAGVAFTLDDAPRQQFNVTTPTVPSRSAVSSQHAPSSMNNDGRALPLPMLPSPSGYDLCVSRVVSPVDRVPPHLSPYPRAKPGSPLSSHGPRAMEDLPCPGTRSSSVHQVEVHLPPLPLDRAAPPSTPGYRRRAQRLSILPPPAAAAEAVCGSATASRAFSAHSPVALLSPNTSRVRDLRGRWRRALISAMRQLPRHRLHLALGRTPPIALDLPATGADGFLSPHLRAVC